MVQSQSQQWLIRAWRLIVVQFLLLSARTFGQLEHFYKAGTVVGGMASPTGRPYYTCPPGFLRMANSCYRLSTTAAPWREAHFQCRDLGAQLAAFERPWEEKIIRRFLNNANLPAHERWIGASYDSRLRRWVWAAKGTPTTYKSFPRAFVDDGSSGERERPGRKDWSWHCLALNPDTRYLWRPRPCMKRNYFLCEMPLHCVVGPNDGVITRNGTTPALFAGRRCGALRRPERRNRQRRPGSGRHPNQSPKRPGQPGEMRRQRISPNDPEGGRRRDKSTPAKKARARQRNQTPRNAAVDYHDYRLQYHADVPRHQETRPDEELRHRGRADRRQAHERTESNSEASQNMPNKIPIYPLEAESPLVRG